MYIYTFLIYHPLSCLFSLFPGCCGMYYVLVATGHSHRDPGESASDPHEHTNVSKVYLRRNVGTRLASYFDHILMHVHGALPRERRRRTDARRSSCTRTRAARIFMYESDKRVKKERKREKENSCRRAVHHWPQILRVKPLGIRAVLFLPPLLRVPIPEE